MIIKKMLVLVLASCMVFSTQVFAADATDAEAAQTVEVDPTARQVINGIGLLTDFELPDGASVKRGEFAHAVAELMDLSGKTDYDGGFSDVSSATTYSGDIYALTEIGILHGFGDGTFHPNDPILLCDAVKVILAACGYSLPAESAGGYTVGYLTYAQRAGLLKDMGECNLNAEFNSDVLYRLLYNAIDVDIMSEDEFVPGKESVKVQKDKTLLTEIHHIYKDDGVVTSTEYSSINSSEGAGEGKAKIGGVAYYSGDCEMSELLGYHVDFWYRQNDGKKDGTLVFAIKSDKNKVFVLETDDIVNVSGGAIRYVDDNDRERSISFNAQTDIVYNGGLYVPGGTATLNISNGSLTLIDNDGNGRYEVIIARDYRPVYTTGIDRAKSIIYDKYDSENPIYTDDYKNVVIYDRNGDLTTLDALESVDDLLMCLQSKDKSNLEIRQVVDEIVGEIESVMTDGDKVYVTIGGVEYRVANHLNDRGLTWKIGDKVICYLDNFGKIAALSSKKFTSGTWAYLREADKIGSSFSDDVSVQLLDINCEDNELKVIECADRVKVDGTSVEKGDRLKDLLKSYTDSVIYYYLNVDGKLAKVETENGDVIEKAVSNLSQLVYDEDTKILGGKIPVSPSTNVFYAPPDGNEDDYTAGYVTNSFIRDQYCNIKYGYRKSGGGLTIDALLMSEPLSGGALTKQSPVMMVDSVTKGLNEDEIAVSMVCGYVGGTYRKFVVSDDSVVKKAKAMNDINVDATYAIQRGDLVRYELNTKGELKIVELIYRCENGASGAFAETNPSDANYFAETRTSSGYVYHKDGAVLMIAQSKDDMTTGNENVMECVRASGGCAIYIYDRNESRDKNRLRLGGADDVYDYKSFGDNASQVAMYMGNGAVKALIVIK